MSKYADPQICKCADVSGITGRCYFECFDNIVTFHLHIYSFAIYERTFLFP